MILAIDGINIRAGGGLTHLAELLNSPAFVSVHFQKIVLFTAIDLENKITNKDITIKHVKLSKKDRLIHLFFPGKFLERFLDKSAPTLLFAPSGTFYSSGQQYVSMSQNMLVFEEKERNRFPFSISRYRYNLLQLLQSRSLKHAAGNIFISNYAQQFISNLYPSLHQIPHSVIYHGVSDRFKNAPTEQLPINYFNPQRPFRFLYVSIINYYKHQDVAIKAILLLNAKKIPVHLDLVGPMNDSIKNNFEKLLSTAGDLITYHGMVPFNEIHKLYKTADAFYFGSTCENMPNILIEAMSAGLPVLSSNYGPMPEVLKSTGLYCDPTVVENVAEKMEQLINDVDLRRSLSISSFEEAKPFSWEKCAAKTMSFLEKIALN